jgi:Protein of unknown function (DUF3224)
VGSHLTRRVGITAGALLLATGTQVTSASPPGPGHGSQPVEFTTTVQIVGGDAGCDPTDPARCAGTFRSIRTYAGDLTGTAYLVGSAVLLGDSTYQGQAVAQFTGQVEGCGSGTLIMLEAGVLDPVSGADRGTWSIVAGQGTGDLAGASGSGTAEAATGASGTVRCR